MSTGTETEADAAEESDRMEEAQGKARGLHGSGAPNAVAVDHGPTKLSSVAAVVAGFVAALTSGPFSLLALPLALGGVAMIAGGLFWRTNRTWVTTGTMSLYLAPIIAGALGVAVELLLLSVVSTFLAWNFGQRAIDLGEQVGRHSTTARNEAINISLVTFIGFASAALGYGVYTVSEGSRPVAAVAMLVLAALFLSWAMRS